VNKAELQQIRDAYIQLVREIDGRLAVTFNFGYRVSSSTGRYNIKGFINMVESEGLGRMWHRRPASERITAIGFAEHMGSNPHWHAVIHAPVKLAEIIEADGPRMWRSLVRRGQLWVTIMPDDAGWAQYITKELPIPSRVDDIFVHRPASDEPRVTEKVGD
jgi:hypothetical protein